MQKIIHWNTFCFLLPTSHFLRGEYRYLQTMIKWSLIWTPFRTRPLSLQVWWISFLMYDLMKVLSMVVLSSFFLSFLLFMHFRFFFSSKGLGFRIESTVPAEVEVVRSSRLVRNQRLSWARRPAHTAALQGRRQASGAQNSYGGSVAHHGTLHRGGTQHGCHFPQSLVVNSVFLDLVSEIQAFISTIRGSYHQSQR